MLSTKTLDNEALAYAQTKNLEVHCIDFIETKALPFNLENIKDDSFDAIAFTSANAVKYFFENTGARALVGGKQIFALVGRTKDELLTRGIKANITAGSADELADAIIASKSAQGVLHVCGNLKLPVLEKKLKAAGVLYNDVIVYETITHPEKKVNGHFAAILFYSPSGVESFLAENNFEDQTVCCCIGATTAQALKKKKNTANIILPAQPSPIFMLSVVSDYLRGN